MRLVSVAEQKFIISDDAVREAFFAREDIAAMSAEEQEARWVQHLEKLDEFREMLAGIPAIVVGDS